MPDNFPATAVFSNIYLFFSNFGFEIKAGFTRFYRSLNVFLY